MAEFWIAVDGSAQIDGSRGLGIDLGVELLEMSDVTSNDTTPIGVVWWAFYESGSVPC